MEKEPTNEKSQPQVPEKEPYPEFNPESVRIHEPEQLERTRKVETAIQKDFPNTWETSSRWTRAPENSGARDEFITALRQAFENDQEILRQLEQVLNEAKRHWGEVPPFPGFPREGKKNQAGWVGYIASCLKRTPLNEQDPVTDIKRVLRGKKILILGDDYGTMSEMLKFYGAESYGIEIDKYNVLIAHSGVMAENGEPQNQVIEGDVSELFDPNEGQLMQTLKKLGPFDVIFSKGVFNSGSGFSDSYAKRFKANPLFPEDSHIQAFQKHCKDLNTDNGFQLHTGVDEYWMFPEKDWRKFGIPSRKLTIELPSRLFVIPKKEDV